MFCKRDGSGRGQAQVLDQKDRDCEDEQPINAEASSYALPVLADSKNFIMRENIVEPFSG
jgi:hypothetical protein